MQHRLALTIVIFPAYGNILGSYMISFPIFVITISPSDPRINECLEEGGFIHYFRARSLGRGIVHRESIHSQSSHPPECRIS